MKKAISLFMLALAWTGAVCAQTTTTPVVSEKATAADQLTDGYYILKCQTTATGGSISTGYAYHNPSQGRPFRFSSTSSTAPDFSNGVNDDNVKFVWCLKKDAQNTTFTLQNVKSSAYIPADNEKNKNMEGANSGAANLAFEKYTATNNTLPNGVILYQTNNQANEANQPTNLYWHANSPGGDLNLSYWNGNGVPGTTVQVEFYKVADDQFFELTYVYKQGSSTAHSQKVSAIVGCSYPGLGTLPFGVEATALTGKVTAEDKTTPKEITWRNTMFTEGQFYFLNIGNSGGYLHDEAGDQAQMNLGTDYGTKTLGNKGQLWKFVGDPWNGYKIVNGETGGILNANPTDAGSAGGNNPVTVKDETAVPQDHVSLWIATASSNATNGFYLNLKGYNNMKMNYRKPKLAFWTGGADGGSTFTINTALPEVKMATEGSESFASVYYPFAVSLPEGVKAYVANAITGTNQTTGTLDLKEVTTGNVVPENTGVVLVKTPAAANVVLNLAAENKTTHTNQFKGTLAATPSTDKLALGLINTKVGFYSVGTNIEIPANRAYLEKALLGTAQALKLNFNGEATNIELVEGEGFRNNAPIFDMSGRRVMKTVKGGLYIQGGKKFIAQ